MRLPTLLTRAFGATLSTRVFVPVLAVACALALPLAAQTQPQPVSQITVTGEGVFEAVPDIATVSLGVTTEGDTAAEAMRANSAALTAVLARLTAAGIAARDIQTSNLSLNPNFSNYDGSSAPKVANYIASNILTVRVRALDGLGTVLDAVVTDGANALNGITFGLSEPKPAMDEARKRAVADAVARATLLVTAAGGTLGPVLSISEGGGYMQPQPMYRMEQDAASAVPVAAGELGITAAVTMVFAIGE